MTTFWQVSERETRIALDVAAIRDGLDHTPRPKAPADGGWTGGLVPPVRG